MLRWWVQTSGRRADYRFLGNSGEPDRWWAPYLQYSAPEDPMFVAETSPSGWRLYVTAMPTGRRDGATPPRHIRVSILAEGALDDSRVLAQVLSGRFDGSLAEALKKAMPEPMVERWLSGHKPASEELSAVKQAFTVARIEGHRRLPPPPAWSYGPAANPENQRSLIEIAESAASHGEQGVFCWLNLLAEPKNLLAVPRVMDAKRVVVLLDDGEAGRLVPWVDESSSPPNPRSAGGQEEARPTGPSNSQNRANYQRLILMGLGLALALIVLILVATLRDKPREPERGQTDVIRSDNQPAGLLHFASANSSHILRPLRGPVAKKTHTR